MARRGIQLRGTRIWRRVLSCVLAYALALQAFSFAAGASQAARLAAQDADQLAFAGLEICVHSAAAKLPAPNSPQQIPAGDDHCPFCIYSPLYLNCAPPHATHATPVAMPGVAWPFAASRLMALIISQSAWPRGPPVAA